MTYTVITPEIKTTSEYKVQQRKTQTKPNLYGNEIYKLSPRKYKTGYQYHDIWNPSKNLYSIINLSLYSLNDFYTPENSLFTDCNL